VSQAQWEIMADADAVARRAADFLLAQATACQSVFTIALSGGSTPRRLYRLLADPPYVTDFPWFRTHLFWGDERFVPHDSALSNYRMVRETLLSRVPVPTENIHAVPTAEFSLNAAASVYEGDLKSFYGADVLDPERPLFDVTLLGLGPDGHTASLFPGSAVLAERDRWVAAVSGVDAQARVTLTYPALESSRHTVFLVSGVEKQAILARFRRGDATLPAVNLHPRGELRVFADAAAARGFA
jgi:6-phosphogluconolactonase